MHDNKLIDASRKLAGSMKLAVGVAKDKLIVYITDDYIPNFIPVEYEGFPVEVKNVGRIRPC